MCFEPDDIGVVMLELFVMFESADVPLETCDLALVALLVALLCDLDEKVDECTE